MIGTVGLINWLRGLDDTGRRNLVRRLPRRERAILRHAWPLWGRSAQTAPAGDWYCWLICAGRGFGKTRAGAEWVRAVARSDPAARIALVGATASEVRSIMVEGESGLLSVIPAAKRPEYEPSLRRMTFANGAQAFLYSAGEPESLRGPQHSHARRPGPEGVLHQRSACPDRCAAPPRLRGRGSLAPRLAGRWRRLARRLRCHLRVDRRGRQVGELAGRRLALHRAERRHAIVRPLDRTNPALCRRLAEACRAFGTKRRHECGQRGACRYFRPDRRAGRRRYSCSKLRTRSFGFVTALC